MNDPYTVLGVSPSASDDEVKAAYRALAKKYHPDNYADNPLADLAAEKMKEINEAYDEVLKQRGTAKGSSRGRGYGANAGGYTSGGFGGGSARYNQVRQMINAGQVGQAQSILDGIPINDRDAEWHFLMGSVMYRKGWINEAFVNFQNAYRMEPNNPEYRSAVERVSGQMNGRFTGGSPFGGYNGGSMEGCNGCDLCSSLLCADCLCSGCGGGGC